MNLQAGLLTSGSLYWLCLPLCLMTKSGYSQRSFPVTAAGPSRNHTGFPFKLSLAPEDYKKEYDGNIYC